jgi:AcrR family transcriptional regulator
MVGSMARQKGPGPEHILARAEALFAEQAYADTSLRQLIERAEVSPTAFYARFASREAVLEALVTRLLGEIYQTAAEVTAAAPSLEEGIEAGVKALVNTLGAHPIVVRLALTEAMAIPGARKALEEALAQQADLIAARLDTLSSRGRIAQVDSETVGWALVGALLMQIQRWAVFGALTKKQLPAALLDTARALLPPSKRGRR